MRTILALTKAHILRFFRDKVYIFFMLIMPVMFLVVFGMMYSNDFSALKVAVFDKADGEFSQQFVEAIISSDSEKDGVFTRVEAETREKAEDMLIRGEIDAIIELPESFGAVKEGEKTPSGEAKLYYQASSAQVGHIASAVLQAAMDEVNKSFGQEEPPFSVMTEEMNKQGLSQFDYVFAGLLGYTILSLGLMGIANIVPGDKESGAAKRIHAAPVSAAQFVFSYLLTFLVLGVLIMAIMVMLGLTLFNFQMRGSWLNFAAFSLIATVMMFGFGLLVAGAAKNEAQASAAANLVMFPMMFLSGVFFPLFMMPETVQKIASFIPLTPVVDGLRMILTENYSLAMVAPQLAVIGVWGVIIYVAAIKLFKWE